MEPFTFDLPNWHKLTPKTVDFLFGESEKCLVASIAKNAANRQAAYRIMAALLPVLALSAGYLLAHPDWRYFWAVAAFVALELAGLVFLVLAVRSQPVYGLGADPSSLIRDSDIMDYDPDEMEPLQYVGIVLNYMAGMQGWIKHNEAMNTVIAKKVNKALVLCGIAGPVAFVMLSFWAALC